MAEPSVLIVARVCPGSVQETESERVARRLEKRFQLLGRQARKIRGRSALHAEPPYVVELSQ